MKARVSGLTIELSEDEIGLFWNIIMFALDLQSMRDKNNESCMTKNELALAKELAQLTDKIK